MDDITLGGPVVMVTADVALITLLATSHGLVLKEKKCETIKIQTEVFSSNLLIIFNYRRHYLELLCYKVPL